MDDQETMDDAFTSRSWWCLQERVRHTGVGRGQAADCWRDHLQRLWLPHDWLSPHPYMTAAAALGGTRQEVDSFVGRLMKAYQELQQRQG